MHVMCVCVPCAHALTVGCRLTGLLQEQQQAVGGDPEVLGGVPHIKEISVSKVGYAANSCLIPLLLLLSCPLPTSLLHPPPFPTLSHPSPPPPPTTGSSSCPMMSCWRSSHRQGTHRLCSLTSESALTPSPSELGLTGKEQCMTLSCIAPC